MEDEKEENDGEMKINAGFVIDPVNAYLCVWLCVKEFVF
jgi:hypothetical protein